MRLRMQYLLEQITYVRINITVCQRQMSFYGEAFVL